MEIKSMNEFRTLHHNKMNDGRCMLEGREHSQEMRQSELNRKIPPYPRALQHYGPFFADLRVGKVEKQQI
jgi:hypothetical protein